MGAGGLQWWCSAQGVPWTWEWRPYPGVWLFVLALAAVYVFGVRWTAAGRGGFGAAGLLVLWAALDWPIGALGGGYLASVHMLQFLLIALVAPVLLLLGVPAAAWRRLAEWRGLPALRLLTHPLVTLAAFQAVVIWTHLPAVVDTWMATQAGSFALDAAWLVGGLVFWWPVVAPVPERRRFPAPLKMAYLFLATVLNTMPYAFLTFGETPYYGIYELAPPVAGIPARQDQQVAGLLMKVGGGAILWTAITVVWFRWYRRDDAAGDRPAAPPLAAG
ncbi:MAG: cytochrome c oxidase assembly protein [Gemmatimonadota bacterium]|nr:cytochrome c oxidase assembly protein [Gemmatimonadota bacterium]